jgi:hypothetical protein
MHMRGWIIRIAIIAAIAGGAYLFRDRLSSNAGDLKVGDCFDQPTTATGTIKDVQHHPCTESHNSEVFFVGNHPAASGTPALTRDQILAFGASTCLPAYNAYTGTTLDAQGPIDFGVFYPLEAGWAKGERSMTCYLYRVDNAMTTTSLKKSP